MFLGTPHQGTAYSRYGSSIARLLAPLDADLEIMRILQSESSSLEDLEHSFRRDCQGISLKFFYEGKKTRRQILGFIPFFREFVRWPISGSLI